MRAKDPSHWLYRLSPEEWLRAADKELLLSTAALVRGQQRPGVASARRAAGMAWNGVLALAETLEERYGRSYMDHLKALMDDPSVPGGVQGAARALLQAPLATELIPLGRGDTRLAEAAGEIVAHARARVHAERV